MQENRNLPAGYPVRLTLHALLLGLCINVFGQAPEDQTAGADQETDSIGQTSLVVDSSSPQTFGWIEKTILSPELQWKLDAKLDTGADTSSLDAVKIRRVRFKGKRYVRFSIRNPETGEMVSLRRPYVRTVRIRQHSGNHQRRYVALMTVCLGAAERTIEVTLTNREDFDYPMLLGRSALAGLAMVDSLATYTTEPSCRKQFSPESESVDEAIPKPSDAVTTVSDSTALSLESSFKPGEESRQLPGQRRLTTASSTKRLAHHAGERALAVPKNTASSFGVSGLNLNSSVSSFWPLSRDQYVRT